LKFKMKENKLKFKKSEYQLDCEIERKLRKEEKVKAILLYF